MPSAVAQVLELSHDTLTRGDPLLLGERIGDPLLLGPFAATGCHELARVAGSAPKVATLCSLSPVALSTSSRTRRAHMDSRPALSVSADIVRAVRAHHPLEPTR